MSEVLTARELGNLQLSSVVKPYLIDKGIMGQAEKRITYALPKHLKTMEAFWEGFHIAGGINYLNFKVMQGRVLYIGLEGTLSKLQPRIFKMRASFPDSSWDNFAFTVLKPLERNISEIGGLISKQQNLNLTIIDPLTSLLAREDKKEDVEGLLKELDRLIDTYHTAMHIIHHARKGRGQAETLENMRGSTALPGWADTICRVSRVNSNKDKINLSFETRYGEDDLEDIVLNFDREHCSFSEDMSKVALIKLRIGALLCEAEAQGKRLYISDIKSKLEDEASDRTIDNAMICMDEIEEKVDDIDRRKRYLARKPLHNI